ncbi:MAG: ATP synthase subunit I [Actinomycetota bacterium]
MIGDFILGLMVGLIAGGVFFGGLQWTLSRMATAQHVLLLVVSSFLLRSAVVVGLLVVVVDGQLIRVLGVLVGILVMRTVLVARARAGLDVPEESSWT